MEQLLLNINDINNSRTTVEKLVKLITVSSVTYSVYYTRIVNDAKILENYEHELLNMLHGCFNANGSLMIGSNGYWIISFLDGIIVAALYIQQGAIPFVWNVCRNTEKKYSGFGFGEELIKYMFSYIKNNYPLIKQIKLYASQTPTPRDKFYEHLGFVRTGNYNHGDPEMVKIID